MKHKILYESPYDYDNFSSEDGKGGRFYDCNGQKLPSVTTVLSATKSKDAEEGLQRWKDRVGEEEAERIRIEASTRGTHMHHILEKQIMHGDLWDYRPTTGEEKRAYKMACNIMDNGFPKISQVYGCEVSVYYPNKYAGKADVIGVFEDDLAIMDFKQTNKPKRREWVGDYFHQLAAYALAHNEMYGTNIQKGVVLMSSVDLNYQEFTLSGDEFREYGERWLEKVSEYYTRDIMQMLA